MTFYDSDIWHAYYIQELKMQRTDRILGSVHVFGIVIGLVGNTCAACYFWKRRQKSIHDLLYLSVTSVDIITVILSVPLAVSLLNDRQPMLFSYSVFCTGWKLLMLFTVRISMFLTMMICITRTLAMKYPNRPIRRSWVKVSVVGYAIYIVVMYAINFSQGWHYCEYSHSKASCTMRLASLLNKHELAIAKYFGQFSASVELVLPSVVTFICFLISTHFLMTRPVLTNDGDRKFRRASITISIFTAVFLACNAPSFIYFIIFVSTKDYHDINIKIENRDFKYYGHIIILFFPIFLNTVLNPLLYLLRMKEYQRWVGNIAKKIKQGRQVNAASMEITSD